MTKRGDDLDDFLEQSTRRIQEIQRSRQKEEEQMVLPLPDWPAKVIGVPSTVVRSALFGLVKKGARRFVNREKIASWGGVTIRYTGSMLDQGDLDVWMQAIKRSKKDGLGNKVPCSLYSLLRDMGRKGRGKSDREWLKSSVNRMVACSVEIETEGAVYSGNLIREFFYDKHQECFIFSVNPRLAKLFTDDYTQIPLAVRQQLGSNFLKWLHAYILSHKATASHPHYIKVENLKNLSGSQRETRKFKADLKQALEEMKKMNILEEYWFTESNVLYFVRKKSVLLDYANLSDAP
ncbi:plasmid replication initiator TrfA [Geoalkalibacter subterraneus]|uniref:Uncharacterized protein n=1 Tax=Geoalkalibacter subterraneus TaxID=483547 RepID=A0A0B5FUA7_9BACT|nr:plasmid replication initiator TrfA [Geoalkalibacter subterraneus]AJF08234.1 hypothetical protein GSUB_17265 [Geoalkalibacter subterraneus]